jgi:hypothetical protein
MSRSLHVVVSIGAIVTAVLTAPSARGEVNQEAGVRVGASAHSVVDPDQQVAAFAGAAARSGGVLADAPAPAAKAALPASRLGSYPKLTARQLRGANNTLKGVTTAAPPSERARDLEVIATRTLSDGSSTVTIYDPAPGVSPATLAESLRRHGKKNARVVALHSPETSLAAGLSASSCTNGTAHALSCPVSYWANNGFEDPLVRFNDHSSAAWPVASSVYKWNQTPNIDSLYLWNKCPFQAGARCVDVFSANYGSSEEWVGLTTLHYATGQPGRLEEQGNFVQLNDFYNVPSRANVAVHELGHALGLGHNDRPLNVLYPYANSTTSIGVENPALLASIYSIRR